MSSLQWGEWILLRLCDLTEIKQLVGVKPGIPPGPLLCLIHLTFLSTAPTASSTPSALGVQEGSTEHWLWTSHHYYVATKTSMFWIFLLVGNLTELNWGVPEWWRSHLCLQKFPFRIQGTISTSNLSREQQMASWVSTKWLCVNIYFIKIPDG